MNQLKALIDLCHVHGLAVILDVVYNHAGGDFGDESLYFFDRQPTAGGNRQLALLHRPGARRRAGLRLREAGGARLPDPEREVLPRRVPRRRLPLRPGERHRPRRRAARLALLPGPDLARCTTTGRGALDKAEYWNVEPVRREAAAARAPGFDTTLTDGLRIAIRDVIANASQPDERPARHDRRWRRSLWPDGFPQQWRFVQGPENHDIVYRGPRAARRRGSAIPATRAPGTAAAARASRPGSA